MRPDVVRFSKCGVFVLLTVLGTISLILLAGTAWFSHIWESSGEAWDALPFYGQLLWLTSLAGENNPAVWFSSMLLLLIAILAVLCFAADHASEPQSIWRFGWIGLAVIFAGLSLDELGSLHERATLVWHNGGDLAWFLPFLLIVPAYMLPFAWHVVSRCRPAGGLVLLGILLLTTVPLQELFEVSHDIDHGWQRPVFHTLLEEGSELAAMLCFIAALCFYALLKGNPVAKSQSEIYLIPAQHWLLALLAIFTIGALFVGLLFGNLVPDGQNGIPQNWPPSALAFLAATLAFHRSGSASTPLCAFSWQLVSAASLATSMLTGGNLYSWEPEVTTPLQSIIITVTVIGWLAMLRSVHHPLTGLLVTIWALLLVWSLCQVTSGHVALASIAFIPIIVVPATPLSKHPWSLGALR